MVRNELIKEILDLDTADREYIRDVVMASLTDEMPPQLSPDEQEELLKRIDACRKNPQSLLTWEQVKTKLAEQRARRAS